MNVTPELVNHPRFHGLQQALQQAGHPPVGMEVLVRLWGHCQVAQRGENWGKKDPAYVEQVARWTGKPGELFKILTADFFGEGPWVRVDKRGCVTVVNWEKHNMRLVSNWRLGPLGGRPKGKKNGSPSQAKDNPKKTVGLPMDKPLEWSGVDRSGGTKTSPPAPGLHPEANEGKGAKEVGGAAASKEYHWPTLVEWRAAGEMEGLTPEQIQMEWDNQERKPAAERWRGIDVERLRHHAAFVREQRRMRGTFVRGPGSEVPKNGAQNPAAVRIGKENRAKELERLIAEHVANHQSEYAVAEPTEKERLELSCMRQALSELRAELAGLHPGANEGSK